MVSALDILPTFAGLAGARIPTDRVLDGKDILDVLTKPDGKTPHDRFFYQQGGKLRAVRSGNWKLFVSGELYNLESDLGEKTDLAGQHPAIVRRLDAMLVAFKKDIAENSRPVGVVQNPRTLVPRPGVEGEEGFRPTLSIPRKK